MKKVPAERFVRAGDVLVNSTGVGTLGRVAQLREDPPEPTTVDSHITIVRAAPREFYSDFFGYMLVAIEHAIENAGEGCGGQIELSRSSLAYNFCVRYPESISEQQRIVGVLDRSFAAIATAEANAEKNLQNARALFRSRLDSVFTPNGAEWLSRPLGELTSKIGSGATPLGGEKVYSSHGIPFIRSLNVHDEGFRQEGLAFLNESQAAELNNVTVKPGDVLLNITGASIARCCVVPADVTPARVNQHVSIIRPITDTLDAEFLHYLLISKPYKARLLQTGEDAGATRQALTKGGMERFTIAIPNTISDQRSIASELREFASETRRLGSVCLRKIGALGELERSMLDAAFAGTL